MSRSSTNIKFQPAEKEPDRMRPVDLAAIAQGELAQDLDNELALIETQFTTFIAEHKDAAHKTKARVILAITFEYDAEQPSYMGISGRITSVLPKRPGRACLGRIDRTRRQVMCLPSGAGMDSPDQGQLCTQDGRAIDTETGAVLEG